MRAIDSTVAHATPNPDARPAPSAGGFTVRITPDPCPIIRRAAARLVRKTVRDQLAIGRRSRPAIDRRAALPGLAGDPFE
jgi:hypothetical protein